MENGCYSLQTLLMTRTIVYLKFTYLQCKFASVPSRKVMKIAELIWIYTPVIQKLSRNSEASSFRDLGLCCKLLSRICQSTYRVQFNMFPSISCLFFRWRAKVYSQTGWGPWRDFPWIRHCLEACVMLCKSYGLALAKSWFPLAPFLNVSDVKTY